MPGGMFSIYNQSIVILPNLKNIACMRYNCFFDTFRNSSFDAKINKFSSASFLTGFKRVEYTSERRSTSYEKWRYPLDDSGLHLVSNKKSLGRGRFTAPLAGTYQFVFQVMKVSHFFR